MQHKKAHPLEHALYAELYQYHAPGLFAYVSQQTTSREDAEDIVLDVFLSVLLKVVLPSRSYSVCPGNEDSSTPWYGLQ